MVTLIDARKYGKCFQGGQKHAGLSNENTARLLHISKAEWRAYCRGSIPIPDDILIRIIDAGLTFMACRYRNCPSCGDRRAFSRR